MNDISTLIKVNGGYNHYCHHLLSVRHLDIVSLCVRDRPAAPRRLGAITLYQVYL
jgi:hypothetical protein